MWKGAFASINMEGISDSNQLLKWNRYVWMDILKIISTYMIVLIHLCGGIYNDNFTLNNKLFFEGLFLNCITRFAVPCFLMITGVLVLSRERNNTYIKTKVLFLGRRLLFWSVIYVCAKKILFTPDLDIVSELLSIPFKVKSGHLWYLYQLIWCYLLLPYTFLLYRSLNKESQKIFLGVALFAPSILDYLGRMLTDNSDDLVLSMNITMCIQYSALMFLGRYLYDWLKEKNINRNKEIAKMMATAAGGLILLMVSSYFLSYKRGGATHELFGELRFPTLIYGIGVFGIFVLCEEYFDMLRFKFKKMLGIISDSLLGVYLGHCLLQWIMEGMYEKTFANILLFGMLQLALSIFCSCVVMRLRSDCCNRLRKDK